MLNKKKSYYINPRMQTIFEAREDAIYYLNNRDRNVYGFRIVDVYPDAKDIFSSGSIIDNVAVIPATDTERRILSKANFTISEDNSDKVFLIKDPSTGGIRGAISISTDYGDDEESECDIDDAFDDKEEDPFLIDDEDNEDEEDYDDQDEDSKETVIRYFDIDPEGKSFKKAMVHVMHSPLGYSIRMRKYKIIRENVDTKTLKMFI
ncbi:MAG: hypothetical protein QXD03_02315 [Candidatus Anstonellales archaeon]